MGNGEIFKPGHHTPPHLFRSGAVYIVTASTYKRGPHIRADHRKSLWVESLKFSAARYDWTLIAWVVLHNHYHFLARAPEDGADSLPAFIGSLHRYTARQWNREDRTPGRKVWWNYWDTCLSTERAYLARLNYIHWNPVKHGLADSPETYPFSSYGKFLAEEPDWIRKIEHEYPLEGIRLPEF